MTSRHIAEEYIGGYWISTVRLPFEHAGGKWFETYVFPAADNKVTRWLEVYGERYATEVAAITGHVRIADAVRTGTIPDDATA